MSLVRLGPQDLLEYNASYGVLICRECRYAIQKSAIRSHLLRHRIFRDERNKLMTEIGQLDLSDPEEVPVPPSSSPPFGALPVLEGFCCTVIGCSRLCGSQMRMQRHQNESHNSEEFVVKGFRPAALQTFFRGTKLRYFEVTPMATSAVIATEGSHVEASNKASDRRSSVSVDLQTLRYFHHFTATTSLSLPTVGPAGSFPHYWQEEVVALALEHSWLMHGLLAVSASHLALEQPSKAKAHQECSMQFMTEFFEIWKEPSMLKPAPTTEAMRAGQRVSCILELLRLAPLPASCSGSAPDLGASPYTLLSTLRDLLVPSPKIPSNDAQGDTKSGMIAQTRELLNSLAAFREKRVSVDSPDDSLQKMLLRLSSLPIRMADAFGRPDSLQDTLTALTALDALVKSCQVSFASDKPGAAWQGVATWLAEAPGYFFEMLSREHPAAFTVLAHWTPLLDRAEGCGFWFLQGLSQRLRHDVMERLQVAGDISYSLVEGLPGHTR